MVLFLDPSREINKCMDTVYLLIYYIRPTLVLHLSKFRYVFVSFCLLLSISIYSNQIQAGHLILSIYPSPIAVYMRWLCQPEILMILLLRVSFHMQFEAVFAR